MFIRILDVLLALNVTDFSVCKHNFYIG